VDGDSEPDTLDRLIRTRRGTRIPGVVLYLQLGEAAGTVGVVRPHGLVHGGTRTPGSATALRFVPGLETATASMRSPSGCRRHLGDPRTATGSLVIFSDSLFE
jgi:hypothetical protein